MRKLPARKLLGTIITAALFMPQNAFTLGLGEIEVNSALNQKFSADIELLSATPEDAEDLIVKLASREEFSRAGLDRPYLLNDLRFKTEVKDGVPHILVTSSSPIREPFLNFLMEVDWPNGHLMREYTVLLDPPVFMTQSAAPATTAGQAGSASDDAGFRPQANTAAAVVPVTTAGSGLSSRPMASNEQLAAPPAQNASQPVASSATGQVQVAPVVQYQPTQRATPGTYRIKQGDTAWSLADAMRPDQSISVPQMMVALLRSNPESFINENVNGLKRGYILRVPDYDQIATIDQNEAIALVKQHAAMWREYQQSTAGKQPVTAMEAGTEGKSSGTAGAEDTGNEAYLDIVSAGTGSSASGSGKDPTQMSASELRAELALARERIETERVEKEALQQRVDTLEQNVEKMKGMLSIEDNQMAEVQSVSEPAEVPAESTADMSTEPSSEQMAGEGADETAMADETAAGETDAGSVKSLDEALAKLDAKNKAEPAEESAMDTAEEGEAVFKDEQGSMTVESGTDESSMEEGAADELAASDTMAEPVPQEKPAKPAAVQPAPIVSHKPVDPLTKLLNNPMMLAAAGSGLLLVVALIALLVKRRKAAAENEAEATLMADLEASPSGNLEDVADDVVEQASTMAAEQASNEVAQPVTEETESFDSDSTMILNAAEDTVVAEQTESASQPEEEVRDDIIAEADVYLAYGIYQQAEELLNQAISDNPDRNEYRVKLAETYYAGKNADAFVGVATELKDRVDNNSETWKKVLGMGQDLCADNPLFQGTMVGAPDVAALTPDVPEMDFDLGINAETEEESSDQDTGNEIDFGLELPEEELTDEAAVDEGNELEFDLSETEAVAEAEDMDDDFSLDIDASELDIDSTDEEEPASKAAAVEDIGELDFALEETGVVESESAAEESDADIGLDLTEEAELIDEKVEEIEEVADLGDEEVELDLTEEEADLDMDFDLGEDSTAEELAETSKDESEEDGAIDLSDTGLGTGAGEEDEDEFDLSNLDDVDEVSTKLDLARAYLDMGDHEGTRGILEEVLAEGNDEQKEEASELMAKLG